MTTHPMTVVQVLPELEEGGVECETLEMAKYLAEKGNRSVVISAGGRMVSDLVNAGSTHITWSHIGEKSPRCLKYFFQFRQLLKSEHIHILHLRSRLPAWLGYLAWKSLPVEHRPRLVTTFHGFYSVNSYSDIMTKGEKIIAVSHTIENHIQQYYNVSAEKIHMIYGGFDEKLFDPQLVSSDRIEALRRRWNLNHNSAVPVVMLPARITRLKGHDLFIHSLSMIKDLPWTALCVGNIHEKPYLTAELENKLIALGLSDRVKFVGHCSDMPAALMMADVVVSSSIKPESFGRTIVEGQAMGKAVIAMAHGSSEETVLNKKTGWLVPPNDPKMLADTLFEALTNRALLSYLGQNGRNWVQEQFPIQKMFEKTDKLYQSLIAA